MKTDYTVQTKESYVSESNAARIGKERFGELYVGTHQLPSGRYCIKHIPECFLTAQVTSR